MQLQDNSSSTEQSLRNISEAGFLEYFDVLIRYRKLIGCIVGSSIILSFLVSLLLPKVYMATARILPPQEKSAGLASLINNSEDPLSGFAGSLIGNQSSAALYVGIMKSRSVAEALNQKFKLKELYGLKYIEDVYSKLEARSIIDFSKKDQIISVSVKDHDPQRAADIANAYGEILDQVNRKLNIFQGKHKRVFLEDRLRGVRTDLEKAETDLKAFQEKYHIVAIEEQAKVAIEGAAEIKGKIIEAQTELEVFKQFGTDRQNEAVMLKAKIEELEKQLSSIKQGKNFENKDSATSVTNVASNFYIPFDDLPSLNLQLMRLLREAKIQGKLFELLTAQYEMARIEEAKDVDTIQFLDRAVPPEKKSGPRRFNIVSSSTLISIFFSVLLALFLEYYCGIAGRQKGKK